MMRFVQFLTSAKVPAGRPLLRFAAGLLALVFVMKALARRASQRLVAPLLTLAFVRASARRRLLLTLEFVKVSARRILFRPVTLLLTLALPLMLAACRSEPAPVIELSQPLFRPPPIVVSGEVPDSLLYAVYRRPPVIRSYAPSASPAAPASPADPASPATSPPAEQSVDGLVEQLIAQEQGQEQEQEQPAPYMGDRPPRWQWPHSGPVVRGFSDGSGEGLALTGDIGDPVLAAEDGEVVYAGHGIQANGELIIIRHNGPYLSTYAYNQALRVSKGEQVAAGQQIAELGGNGEGEPLLHFEIRLNGKAVDPQRLLPLRQ